jgi:cytochrome P450
MKRPDFQDKGDLLTILLNDEIFQSNDEIIIDECLTFFFAGSQTTSIAIANMVHNLVM